MFLNDYYQLQYFPPGVYLDKSTALECQKIGYNMQIANHESTGNKWHYYTMKCIEAIDANWLEVKDFFKGVKWIHNADTRMSAEDKQERDKFFTFVMKEIYRLGMFTQLKEQSKLDKHYPLPNDLSFQSLLDYFKTRQGYWITGSEKVFGAHVKSKKWPDEIGIPFHLLSLCMLEQSNKLFWNFNSIMRGIPPMEEQVFGYENRHLEIEFWEIALAMIDSAANIFAGTCNHFKNFRENKYLN